MDLVAAVFLTSHVPFVSGPHQGLTCTWRILLPPLPHRDLVTLFPPGINGTWLHMDLVTGRILLLPGPLPDPGTLVTTWASPGPGESGPHLGLTHSW